MTRPTTNQMVTRLCVTSIALLIIYGLLVTTFGFPRLAIGEIIWLLIGPGLVSTAYKRKYKEMVPFKEAERIALRYVLIMLAITLAIGTLFLSDFMQDEAVWEKYRVYLGLFLLVYIGILLTMGRWCVSSALCFDPKKKLENK
ncbi:MAG: hypothetical protein BMS9Abin02_1999 [Anaerolineae bacterium]|nr:MAG: hypothetical protein BMS9Abin02_1999 [Anaerolineae bacterium]